MSRWTILVASLLVLSSRLPALAQSDGLPHNIELKPGAETTPADETAGAATPAEAKTRQIVTEGKGAPQAAAPPALATPAAATPAKAASPDAVPDGGTPPAETVQGPPPPGPGEIVVAVQTELKRVGCDPGEIDGVWGERSRDALAAFGHFAKVDVQRPEPTPEILVIIKGKTAPVCRLAAVPDEADEPGPPPEAAPVPPRHHGYGGYGGGGDGY